MSELGDLVSLGPLPGLVSSTPTSSLDLRTHNYAVERTTADAHGDKWFQLTPQGVIDRKEHPHDNESAEAMNQYVSQIADLTPRPSAVPHHDWESIEENHELSLPTDYRELVDSFGGGVFDGYLWFLEPDCRNRHYDLAANIDERVESLEYLWESGEPKPPAVAEPKSRLIPWASTDNGEFFYWLAKEGQAPDLWQVLINEARGEDWEHYAIGCAQLLAELLSGRIQSELLSSSFPKSEHTFQSSAEFI
ncbi:MAG: SMI1/KNR4 family protein [Streptomyces sp.]|uniref:SMI1/KNR4 family protein n=1 Tax=Streptomyces sp. TaxID=1931 RepID=UPI003D6C2B54